jgi:hypothetical protein
VLCLPLFSAKPASALSSLVFAASMFPLVSLIAYNNIVAQFDCKAEGQKPLQKLGTEPI